MKRSCIRSSRPLIFQNVLLPELAPWLAPGCRGFTGPVPLPLWIRAYRMLFSCRYEGPYLFPYRRTQNSQIPGARKLIRYKVKKKPLLDMKGLGQYNKKQPLIFQIILPELAPWLTPGCRGFTGPVPLPLWIRASFNIQL